MEKIGEGGEAEVFALDRDRVLRRFRADHPSIPRRIELMRAVARGAGHLDVEVPELLDHGVSDDGRPWFVERRLPGRSMTEALTDVTGEQRHRLLHSYVETAHALRRIEYPTHEFGELITEEPLRAPTWAGYLSAALDRQVEACERTAYPELSDLDDRVRHLHRRIDDLGATQPHLVHFDYFPGNVLCDGHRITAVIDWSVLAIAGDPDLDVALAVAYLGVTPTADADDDTRCRRWLAEHGLTDISSLYEQWGAAWWLPLHEDENIRSFAAGVLSPGPEAPSRTDG